MPDSFVVVVETTESKDGGVFVVMMTSGRAVIEAARKKSCVDDVSPGVVAARAAFGVIDEMSKSVFAVESDWDIIMEYLQSRSLYLKKKFVL